MICGFLVISVQPNLQYSLSVGAVSNRTIGVDLGIFDDILEQLL